MNSSLESNNFLILTYNEGAKRFVEDDCNEVIEKINKQKPLFIIVCTQESRGSGNEHYQHVLREKIKYNYRLLLKIDNSLYKGSIINPYSFYKSFSNKNHNKVNKNVRTRIYYLASSVFSQKSEIEYNNLTSNTYNLTNEKNIEKHPYFIEYIEIKKSKETDLGKAHKGTLFKGSNFSLLHIKDKKTNNVIKIIIVNSHFFFSARRINNEINTGYTKREKEFFNLLKEFNLLPLYNEGYNVFFCGDLNFRLDRYKKVYKTI